MLKPIDAAVKAGLAQRRGEWRSLADLSGVSYSWISKFVNNKIPNPGIETLRKLQRAMEGEPA
jgi:transcriptional regulator with XRE-family HTH domain